MRCADEIRANGVAPIPVADTCQQAHKSGPKTRRLPSTVVPSSAHQPKNAREFEGGALIGSAADVPDPFLVNKRLIVTEESFATESTEGYSKAAVIKKFRSYIDTHDHRNRKKGCGAWTAHGLARTGIQERFIKLNCKCWDCRHCGPLRAKRYRRAIGLAAERCGLNRFLTLTLDPKKLDGEDSTKYIKRTWAKLRTLLHRQYGKALTYICVLEYHKSGIAHLHILLNQRIEQAWLKAKWQAVGGGWKVWIKMVTIRVISNYISKYLTKDLLLSAPKGTRRVTTSRDIRLFSKAATEFVWSLIRAPIEYIRESFSSVSSEVYGEIDGLLTQFAVLLNVA